MLQLLLHNLQSNKQRIKRVHFIVPQFTPFLPHYSLFSSVPVHPSRRSSPSAIKPTNIHPIPINFRGIAKDVMPDCSYLFDCSSGETLAISSLKYFIFRLYCISPETVRRFWRVHPLKPQDVLEILLGFQCVSNNFWLEAEKIESLWGIFRRASQQSKGFVHLSQSYKIMASMLIRAGMFEDVECLLSMATSQEVLFDNHEIFSNLIQGYVGERHLEKAVASYDRMRILGLVPSLSCYELLLKFLVQLNVTQLAPQIFADAITLGMGRTVAQGHIYGSVVRLLCADGKVQDARNLVKKVLTLGIKPSNLVLNAMVTAYCEKRDYDDILSFFVEVRCIPSVHVANKIIHSLCTYLGSQCANSFRLRLEELGFSSNEITLGILIGWSCREGKIKDAFIYFNEILSRRLKPQVYSYDALLSGLFKQGMWKHSQEILYEMKESTDGLQLSTLMVLLAGLCKARQFEEVKAVVFEMADCGFIQPTPLEDPLSKVFTLLGLCPTAVKIRRDSELGYSEAEFYDNLGNGLYLDTDLEKYEAAMTKVLDDAMLPDFKSQILKSIQSKSIKETVIMVGNMVNWGQELCLPLFSTLAKGFCEGCANLKTVIHLFEENPKFNYHQLDHETLNTLAQTFGKKGLVQRARIIVNGMLLRRQNVENRTHTILLIGLCNKGDGRALANYWHVAQKYNWFPDIKDGKTLLHCLCRHGFHGKALELFEAMLVHHPHKDFGCFNELLEQLCAFGFTNTAHVLLKTLADRGYNPDHMSYDLLVCSFCKEKKFSKALLICETMLAKNFTLPLEASVLLIQWLCRNGNIGKAVFLKDSFSREQPSALLYVHRALIHGLCQSGAVGKASSLYKELHMHGLSHDKEVYNSLAQGYAKAKNFKKIGELLGVMTRRDMDLTAASYRNLLSLMFAESKLCLALSLKKLVISQNNLPPTLIYNILIFRMFSADKVSFLNTILHEIQSKGLPLEEVSNNFLIQGFSQCKDVTSSLQYLKDMMQKGLRPNNRSLREVIKCLCCNGELEKAFNLSEEMELRGWKLGSVIQNALVEGLLARGKLSEAVQLMDRVELKDLIPGNINYDVLIKRFCQHGEVDKAVDLLNIMLKKGNNSPPDSSSYDYIIQCFCSHDLLDQALDFHAEMLCRSHTANKNTWSALVQCLCRGRRVAEAETLLDTMVQMGETPSREMYSAVINGYRFENNSIKASQVLHRIQQDGYEPDFNTHWALICNLSSSSGKNKSEGFLSRFLSDVGFSRNNPNAKKG
ncbi:hypothetical protein DM860_014022 [Cuscuta australis]|uniref:Pentatricopeptide repeat-containing protein-mitochondrial domain-containing protein n=1 Tax=Cuscuta australis TaxID=267555 RepID=A0A328DR38_9ASTE|nr:hypothetical protein DM860_014022 [Cuscuta australis]